MLFFNSLLDFATFIFHAFPGSIWALTLWLYSADRRLCDVIVHLNVYWSKNKVVFLRSFYTINIMSMAAEPHPICSLSNQCSLLHKMYAHDTGIFSGWKLQKGAMIKAFVNLLLVQLHCWELSFQLFQHLQLHWLQTCLVSPHLLQQLKKEKTQIRKKSERKSTSFMNKQKSGLR